MAYFLRFYEYPGRRCFILNPAFGSTKDTKFHEESMCYKQYGVHPKDGWRFNQIILIFLVFLRALRGQQLFLGLYTKITTHKTQHWQVDNPCRNILHAREKKGIPVAIYINYGTL